MYLVAKMTGEVVVQSGKYGSGEPDKESAISFASSQFGIPEGDLLYFKLDDSTVESDRVFTGWSYSLIIESGEIVGVDFSPEMIKPNLVFSMDKEDVVDNGIDTILVTCTAKKEDGTVDSTVTGPVKIPVRTPTGTVADKLFTFVAGVGTSSFKSTVAGEYVVPCHVDRFGQYRVENSVRPNIVME